MVRELKKPELRRNELRKKRYKKQALTIVAVVFFVIVTVSIFFIQQFINRQYNSYEVIQSIAREDSSFAKYISYKDGVIRYSRDGIMAMDSIGNRLWNGTYEMKEPIVDMNGDYVAVADMGNKKVNIYNGGKSPTTITALNNILDVEVASQGVVALLLEADASNLIEVYSFEGEKLISLRTTHTLNGFPVDMDISSDGRSLVTSYMFLNNGVVQNKLTFYNFGKVGQTYTDKIVGGFDYGGTIFPEVKFVNNTTVAAFGEGKVALYKMDNTPKRIKDIDISDEIKSIFYTSEYIGFMCVNLEGEDNQVLVVYDLQGNRILNYSNNFNYNQISMSGKDILIHGTQSAHIMTVHGKEKLSLLFDKNMEYVFPTEKGTEYILIDETVIEKIQLVEERGN